MHLKSTKARPHFYSPSRTIRPIWLTALLVMTACANVSLDEEPEDDGMGGSGPDSGGSVTSGSGGFVTTTSGGAESSGGSDSSGGTAAVGGSLLGSGGAASGGAGSGGAASGGAASGGAGSGGAASGGAASGGAASGGAASGGATGDCGSPTVGSQGSAQCGDTFVHNGALYECISYFANPNWACGGTVSCTNTSPDHDPWGPTAWKKIMNCD